MRLRAPVLARGLATGRTALVKDLRARTSAPMAKCVEALKATDDDVDGAIDWLRKAGLASAGKKAARGAHEGAIALAGTDTALALVEVNTETDFVARNELFHALCADIAASALGLGEAGARGDVDTAALGAEALPGRGSIADAVALAVSQLGENVVLRRATVLGESRLGATDVFSARPETRARPPQARRTAWSRATSTTPTRRTSARSAPASRSSAVRRRATTRARRYEIWGASLRCTWSPRRRSR